MSEKPKRITVHHRFRLIRLAFLIRHDDRTGLAAYAATDAEGQWSEDWARVWIDTGAGQPLPDNHELAKVHKETDQRVLANVLRLIPERAGKWSLDFLSKT